MALEVIGRDEELSSILSLFERIDDWPRALVLSGEAGIGKTILWEAGVEEARLRGARILDPQFRRFARSISALSQAQQTAAVLTALGLDAQDRQYLMQLTSPTPVGQVAAGR